MHCAKCNGVAGRQTRPSPRVTVLTSVVLRQTVVGGSENVYALGTHPLGAR